MNESTAPEVSPRRYSPLGQLILARLREFYREPHAVFWVYGFPILIVVSLGIAFRNKPVQRFTVDVQDANEAGVVFVKEALGNDKNIDVHVNDDAVCKLRLRTGKTDLVVIPESTKKFECLFDEARPESSLARSKVDYMLQKHGGQQPVVLVTDKQMDEPGGRYIDFLIPGLLGMNLMGGGLWGVGFVMVDMRLRKVLKRFLATPMRKRDFLAAIMISRLVFLIPEVFVLLLFARVAFGVVIQGSLLAMAVLIVLGATTLAAGIGLLVASRARTIETVSGLMNLVMLPMWVLSGIFFTPDRFPAAAQPIIQALPLTPLNNALRAVSLEGASLASQWPAMAILAAWGAGSFLLALRWFRWS